MQLAVQARMLCIMPLALEIMEASKENDRELELNLKASRGLSYLDDYQSNKNGGNVMSGYEVLYIEVDGDV